MDRGAEQDARRAEFAQSVWAVIAERGIEGVTLRRVAAEAGASLGRLQHYYDSRDALIQDSCRRMIELAAGSTGNADDVGDTGEPGDTSEPADDVGDSSDAVEDPAAALRGLLQHSIPGSLATRHGTAVWLAYQAKTVDDPVIARLVADAEAGAVEQVGRLIDLIDAARDDDGHPRRRRTTSAPDLALELMALAQGLSQRVLTGSVSADRALGLIDAVLRREGLD